MDPIFSNLNGGFTNSNTNNNNNNNNNNLPSLGTGSLNSNNTESPSTTNVIVNSGPDAPNQTSTAEIASSSIAPTPSSSPQPQQPEPQSPPPQASPQQPSSPPPALSPQPQPPAPPQAAPQPQQPWRNPQRPQIAPNNNNNNNNNNFLPISQPAFNNVEQPPQSFQQAFDTTPVASGNEWTNNQAFIDSNANTQQPVFSPEQPGTSTTTTNNNPINPSTTQNANPNNNNKINNVKGTGLPSANTQQKQSAGSVSGGAIGGIVVCVLALVAVVAFLVFRRKRDKYASSSSVDANSNARSGAGLSSKMSAFGAGVIGALKPKRKAPEPDAEKGTAGGNDSKFSAGMRNMMNKAKAPAFLTKARTKTTKPGFQPKSTPLPPTPPKQSSLGRSKPVARRADVPKPIQLPAMFFQQQPSPPLMNIHNMPPLINIPPLAAEDLPVPNDHMIPLPSARFSEHSHSSPIVHLDSNNQPLPPSTTFSTLSSTHSTIYPRTNLSVINQMLNMTDAQSHVGNNRTSVITVATVSTTAATPSSSSDTYSEEKQLPLPPPRRKKHFSVTTALVPDLMTVTTTPEFNPAEMEVSQRTPETVSPAATVLDTPIANNNSKVGRISAVTDRSLSMYLGD